jgi:hypothetical protein
MENKTYKFAVKGDRRKALVSAMQQLLQAKMEYLGAPSFAYRLADFYIDRDGTVTGPENMNLLVGLLERGFEPDVNEYERSSYSSSQDEQDVNASSRGVHHDLSFHLITPRGTLLCQRRYDTAAEAEADGYGIAFHHEGRDVFMKPAPDGKTEHSKWFAVVGAPFEEVAPAEPEEPEFPTTPELDQIVIEYPIGGFTPAAIDNLTKMVTAKEELIKLAIGADTLPVQVLDDRIAFPWLQTADPELADALAAFIAALCKTALTKKRVTATPQPTGVNDRYRFRCFMLHIGMIGAEYAAARTKLMKPLSGNSGWLSGPPEKAPAPQEETPAAALAEAEAPEAAPAEEAPAAEETEAVTDE